jgi:hypothetical protein
MADYNPTGRPRSERDEVRSHGGGTYIQVKKPAPEIFKGGIADSPIEFNNDVADVTSKLFDLLISKHNDYGPKNISQSPGGPLNGLRVRMWDKLARINNLVESGATPEHESLEDSFKDMANYAIIGLLVLQGKWPNE